MPKKEVPNPRTVQELINQHEIILHGLFVKLPKVTPPQPHQPVEELEHQRCIGIALGHGHQVNVLVLDMAEGGRAEGQDRRADLRVGDDLDAEHIGQARSAVIAKRTEY